MTYTVLTAPTVEPVTAAECKSDLHIDAAEDDAKLDLLIASAREVAEHEVGGWIAPQEARLLLADWPESIVINRGPVRAVKAISYWNGATWVDLNAGAFLLDREGLASVIYPLVDWPALGDRPGNRVRVDLVVGYESVELIPASAKRFVLAQVAAWYAAPESAGARMEINPLLAGLLAPLCTYA